MNIKEMFEQVDKNELVLPDFQRNFVWNKNGQRALAASVLLNLPMGSFLILEGVKDDFATKKLGYSTQEATPTDKCKFLLDGQQRLTSLRSIFGGFWNEDDWKSVIKGIYNSLKTKWFLRVIPSNDEEDIFGWKDLVFDESSLKNIEPLQLESMIVDKTIGISKTDCWWNPDYIFLDESYNKIAPKDGKSHLLGISKAMASEGLLPLSLYNKNSKVLLSYALEYIAQERSMKLKVELENNLDMVQELLDKADINTISDEITVENLDDILRELRGKWKVSVMSFLDNILEKTEAQIISLKSDEIGRAVIIFERINKGGTNLDNFDLVVARAARDSSQDSLTKRIIKYLETNINLPNNLTCYLKGNDKPEYINLLFMETVKNNEINSMIKKQYLNLLSIMANVEYGRVENIKLELTKKEKILNISYEQINDLTPLVLKGIGRACAFLQMRCGLVRINDLHYNLMMLPIAYLLLDDNVWESKRCLDKIEFWYWGSIFSGEYRIYPNQRSIEDIQDLYRMVVMEEEIERYEEMESNVLNVKDFSDRSLLTRESENKEIPVAIHKGLLQYQLSRQPVDLYYQDIVLSSWKIAEALEVCTNNGNIKLEIQDHHVIPLATSTNLLESTKKIRGQENHILNSSLNRTYILSYTNKIFSTKEPIKYLKTLEDSNNTHMLNTHFIPDNYKIYLNADSISSNEEIKKFYNQRFEKIKTILMDELNSLKN